MKFWKRGMALLLAVSACFTFLTACGQTEAAGVCADWYAAPKSFRRNCRLSDFYFQRNFRRLLRWSFRSP